ncbi:MAG: DUF308 domain-containing protein [Mycobacterium sp.]
MLIVALVLAVIGLAALVTAVVTSNELIAWVCIAASVIGVLLLIVDALRERSRGGADEGAAAEPYEAQAYEAEPEPEFDAEYPEEAPITDRVDDNTTALDQPADEVTGDDRNNR